MKALGKTGVEVLPIGLGTWSWGDRGDWAFGRTHDEADVREAFVSSAARGPILVDTAEKYGDGAAERFIGRFIRETGHAVVVASKFSPTRWQLRRADLFRALRGSLERLGRETIDLYQLHWPTRFSSLPARMNAMADAVEEELVRAVGVANVTLAEALLAHDVLARRGVHLSSVQVEFNLLNRTAEASGLLRACTDRGMTLIAYSPMAGGVLTGKYTPDSPPPGLRGARYPSAAIARFAGILEALREVGDAHGVPSAAVALAWVRGKGALPIPGAKNRHQAEENLAGLELVLSPTEMERLSAAAEESVRGPR